MPAPSGPESLPGTSQIAPGCVLPALLLDGEVQQDAPRHLQRGRDARAAGEEHNGGAGPAPAADRVAQPGRDRLGVVGEAVGGAPGRPAARLLEGLGQVPVVQSLEIPGFSVK